MQGLVRRSRFGAYRLKPLDERHVMCCVCSFGLAGHAYCSIESGCDKETL